jgi:hypothetical protein
MSLKVLDMEMELENSIEEDECESPSHPKNAPSAMSKEPKDSKRRKSIKKSRRDGSPLDKTKIVDQSTSQAPTPIESGVDNSRLRVSKRRDENNSSRDHSGLG